MTYSVKNSAQTTTYTVNDNTENSTSTSLVFIGKNYTGYGLALNENFLYLLENFSNTAGMYPANPVPGQLFWDNTNKYMHVYDGTAWKVIYGALNSLTVNTSISSASLTVTNTATSGYSTKDISILGGSTNNIYLIGNTGQGVYNGLVNAGDMLLGFQAATQGNGNLVIAPWASVSGGSGIKINSVANVATITLQSPTTTISGNVGIGTTSPGYTLDVRATTGSISATSNTGTNFAKLQCNNSGGSYQFGIDNSAGSNFGSGTAYSRVIWNDSSTAPTILYTNSTERMRIDSSGNVGIGATTVTANLVVYGSATGISQARVGNSIVQIQDGLGRVVANFLGGVDGSTKPTYATLNLGGAASTSIAFSLATTHGVSIGSNSATISTTGVVAAPTINAGTIGNSGAVFTGASATFGGNILLNAAGAKITFNSGGGTIANNIGNSLQFYADGGTTELMRLDNTGNLNVYGGAVQAATINAGTIGNSGATFTGATALLSGNIVAAYANSASGLGMGIWPSNNQYYGLWNNLGNPSNYEYMILSGTGTDTATYVSSRSGGTTKLRGPSNYSTVELSLSGVSTTVSGPLIPNANVAVSSTLGNSTTYWSSVYANNYYGTNFFGTSTTAKYADLAEKYLPDADYEIGTVMMVGGSAEVTQHSGAKVRAIGVISAYPAYKMNSDLDGGVYVALKGRVPVRVVGPIKKGQSLFGTAHGLAMATDDTTPTTFAIALENFDGSGIGVVEAVIL